ncbi:MAG: SusD/RagB family nutrient-binding outer membrane lipoprotein [Bacteroidia bacterium]|jgi:hypothetical protein|nr:SusD/RagB family nutrient-binding outer membrane lipoprotein [Bacteroidia bacterium]
MKNKILTFVLAGLMLAACTKNFEELDRPKTTSTRIDPGPLFTRSLVTGSGLSVGIWQWMHQISGSVYAQHFANIQVGANFTSDNYEPRAWNDVWEWYYSRANFAPLHYNYHVMNLSREIENPIKENVARVWNVYMMQQVTDMYGDMPYFKAFKEIKPPFDSQKDIYLDLLKELREAVANIEKYQGFGYQGYGAADVLYQGNLDSWKRFANTLYLRIALRASNTPEFTSLILPGLQQINPDQTISSLQQAARIIPDPAGPTYHVKNPLSFVAGWDEVRLSKTMYDILNNLNDPRLFVYAAPNAAGQYVGLPNGQPHSLLSEQRDSHFKPDFCDIGPYFLQDRTPHVLLSYAESCFLKAEAAQKGFIAGNAESYYNEGIVASLNQFGIFGNDTINAYLNGPAKFDPSKALEQIFTQRWIALYPNGHEAWSVVRQSGFPQMRQPVYTFPGNEQMPRRKPFPDYERQSNADNYNAAVARMGGDSQYTRIWWDGGR